MDTVSVGATIKFTAAARQRMYCHRKCAREPTSRYQLFGTRHKSYCGRRYIIIDSRKYMGRVTKFQTVMAEPIFSLAAAVGKGICITTLPASTRSLIAVNSEENGALI